MTAPVTPSVSCTVESPMLISILLLPLMQESTVLWMKMGCVWSKHWGLRSYILQVGSWPRGVLLWRWWCSRGWGTEEGAEAWRRGEHLPNSPLQQLGIHGGKWAAHESRDPCKLAGRHPSRL